MGRVADAYQPRTGRQIWSCRFGCGDGEGVVAEGSDEVEASAECLHVAGDRVDGGEFAALDVGNPSGSQRDAPFGSFPRKSS